MGFFGTELLLDQAKQKLPAIPLYQIKAGSEYSQISLRTKGVLGVRRSLFVSYRFNSRHKAGDRYS